MRAELLRSEAVDDADANAQIILPRVHSVQRVGVDPVRFQGDGGDARGQIHFNAQARLCSDLGVVGAVDHVVGANV